MKRLTLQLILATALVLVAAGCDSGSRKQSVEARWTETMDQARLEAARQSLAEGRLEYAQYVLALLHSLGQTQKDAEKLMADIAAAHQLVADAGQSLERAY